MVEKLTLITRSKTAVLLSSFGILLLLSMPGFATVMVTAYAYNPSNGEVMGGMTMPVEVNSDDTFSVKDYYYHEPEGRWNILDLDLEGDIDPVTNLGFQIQNNMGVTANFVFGVSVPIAPIPGATVHGGSSGISVTDSDFSGSATVSALAGKSFYSGQIDGSTVLPLFSDPFSLSAGPTPGDSSATSTSLGLPATIPSGPALSTIGILVEFSLTAGDQMSSTNLFRVEAIPEPASLLLVGASSLVMCSWRRGRAK